MIKKNYPKAESIQISYSGRFGMMAIEEVIPISDDTNVLQVSAIRTRAQYKVNLVTGELTLDGKIKSEPRVASLVPYIGQKNELVFLDYSLPTGFEGKSLLASREVMEPA